MATRYMCWVELRLRLHTLVYQSNFTEYTTYIRSRCGRYIDFMSIEINVDGHPNPEIRVSRARTFVRHCGICQMPCCSHIDYSPKGKDPCVEARKTCPTPQPSFPLHSLHRVYSTAICAPISSPASFHICTQSASTLSPQNHDSLTVYGIETCASSRSSPNMLPWSLQARHRRL